MPQATFSNAGSRYNLPNTPVNGLPLTGGNGGDGGVNHLLPNIYLSQPVFRSPQFGDLAVGVALSVPFGLETDYSPGWVGRYAALRTKLTTFDVQPTIAYRLFDRIFRSKSGYSVCVGPGDSSDRLRLGGSTAHRSV